MLVARVTVPGVTSGTIRTRPRPSRFRVSLQTLIPPNNPKIPRKPITTDAANFSVEASMLYKVLDRCWNSQPSALANEFWYWSLRAASIRSPLSGFASRLALWGTVRNLLNIFVAISVPVPVPLSLFGPVVAGFGFVETLVGLVQAPED
jgi:hypothetical protein